MRRFKVIRITDEMPRHYAVWNPTTGAVAGRFISESSAEQLRDRLNGGEDANYNPRGILDKHVRSKPGHANTNPATVLIKAKG
jgi:hypothetical protein